MRRTPSRSIPLLGLLAALAVVSAGEAQVMADAGRPVVTLTRPAAWTITPLDTVRVPAGTSVAVEGRILAAERVTSVELDGDRAALRRGEDGATTWFSGFISPPPRVGDVAVELRVRTESGDARVVWLPVEVRAGTDRSARERVEARLRYPDRTRFAVVVGINDYRDPALPDVSYAEADARAVADFLRSPAAGGPGIPPAQVHLLTGEAATARAIRGALAEVLHRATERDVVYLFLAGQVGPEPDRLRPLYFHGQDAEVADLPGTSVDLEEVRDILRRARAHQVVVLADVDRSGLIQQENRRGVFANVVSQAFTTDLDVEEGGLFVLTATEGTEPSREAARWGGGHGAFTSALLEGLDGEADEDGDGVVTLGEIDRWVRLRVPDLTGGAQRPSAARTSYDRYWPLGLVGR